jgi:hypothetical protein
MSRKPVAYVCGLLIFPALILVGGAPAASAGHYPPTTTPPCGCTSTKPTYPTTPTSPATTTPTPASSTPVTTSVPVRTTARPVAPAPTHARQVRKVPVGAPATGGGGTAPGNRAWIFLLIGIAALGGLTLALSRLLRARKN